MNQFIKKLTKYLNYFSVFLMNFTKMSKIYNNFFKIKFSKEQNMARFILIVLYSGN